MSSPACCSPRSKSLGQRLVLDYKTGAGGNVASEVIANAKPDGYSFLLGTAATHGVNPALYPKLSFDVEADFTPISTLVDVSNVPDHQPRRDRRQVGAGLHRQGEGRAGQVQLRLDRQRHRHPSRLRRVQRQGRAGHGACALSRRARRPQAVLKGDVCCIFNQVQTVLQQYRAGKVRLLGVTTKKRVAAIPDIPTIDEAGLPGYERLHVVRDLRPQGPRCGDRAEVQRCDQDGAGRSRDPEEARRARQHAALRDGRAVQGDREARPRPLGRGREGGRS